MIHANNQVEIQVLRDIEGAIMEVIAKVRKILDRKASRDELRQAFHEINEKQDVWEAKLDEVFRLHNRRHEEFQAMFTRCRQLISDLEAAEDLVQVETFRLMDQDDPDLEAIRDLGQGANEELSGWMRRHLQGLKQLFSREQVGV